MAAPGDAQEAAAAAYRALQQRFIQGLPARWAQIDGAADRSARSGALHRLAGAAGGYGLAALDSAARAALQADEAGLDATAMAALLARVGEEIQRALAGDAATPHGDTV